MRNFRTRGHSSLINTPIDAFIIKNGIPYNIELTVEILLCENRFMYMVRMHVVKGHQKYLLFDDVGRIQETSLKINDVFPQNRFIA